MTEKIPLSVAIITKNEGENLHECLKSVEFAAEVVVVDSDSTDETVQIASQFGCEVFIEPWQGFGPQKQSAIDKCTYPWILVLDADERIPAENASVIKNIILNPSNTVAGYSFPRKNYFQGRWIKHMGWWPDRIVRLFRKDLGRMTPDRVHESILVNGPVEPLDAPIEHYTESRFYKILDKINQYSTLGAQEAFEKGQKASIGSAIFRAQLTFIQNYFLRLGLVDGMPGLTLAIADSINKFLKYAKLYELQQRGRSPG
jgi:glycosyltransferase involved in cell wall biosynthesis